jgi:hypothetical protein
MLKACPRPKPSTVIAAGAMIGVSCWFRANALFLVFFLSIYLFLILKNSKGRRYAIVFAVSTLFVIAPIMIRNWIVYKQFIPISLGTGVTLIEGIANYDFENRFDMPLMDADVGVKEAEWYNRPQYAGSLWYPDGIEREQLRVKRGVRVIWENPIWFASTMLRRMSFMVRYNDFRKQDMPYNTTIVPAISATPTFAHPLMINDTNVSPQITLSASELYEQSKPVAIETDMSLVNHGKWIEIVGDDSAQNELYEIARFAVHPDTDYILAIHIQVDNGGAIVKVKTADPRVTLAVGNVPKLRQRNKKPSKKPGRSSDESNQQEELDLIKVPFSSGHDDEIRVILANNNTDSPAKPITQIGQVALYELGKTPNQWTSLPRSIFRGIQKNLYKTGVMRWLIFLGTALLLLARQYRSLSILLIVPIYYLLVQSPLHTEYRYILAMHYFLFVLASVSLYCIFMAGFKLVLHGKEYFIARIRV